MDYASHPELKALLDGGVSPDALHAIEQAVAVAIHLDGKPASRHRFDREPFLVPEGYVTLWEATLHLGDVYRRLLSSSDGKLNDLAIRTLGTWAALGFLHVYALDEGRFGRIPVYCWQRLMDDCGPALDRAVNLELTMLHDKLTGDAFGTLQGLRPVVQTEAIVHAWRRYVEEKEEERQAETAEEPDDQKSQVLRAARRLLREEGTLTQRGVGRMMARERLGDAADKEAVIKLADSLRKHAPAEVLDALRRQFDTAEDPGGN